MAKKVSEKELKKQYGKWIERIKKDETELMIKRHINKHANEVYERDSLKWSASMRNLLNIFDAVFDSKPDTALLLERLENKWKQNKKRYTAPPKEYKEVIERQSTKKR